MVESDHLQRAWKIPPNLAYSVALAHDRLKQPDRARKALRLAIKEYPWIATRICKELEIAPIPKSVWGKEPNGDNQELLCQLYVPHVKDLWDTTEATSLLVEVCYSIEEPLGAGDDPYWLADIDELDLARHILLSDDRALIALLDPHVKAKYTSTSDPLPPEDSIVSYSTASGNQGMQNTGTNQTQLLVELEQLRQYFSNVNLTQHMNLENATEEELLRVLDEAGTSYQEFRRNTERVQQIRPRLQQLGVEVVFRGDERDGDSEAESDG